MREILFKAKCIDETCLKGQWILGCLVIDYACGKYYIHADGNSTNESDIIGEEGILRFVAYEVDPSTVFQYTGLTDKDGKKIFEGDILKCPAYMPERELCVCRWVDASDTYSIRGFALFDCEKLINNDEWEDFEVVGNIFDNPELLKEIAS